MQNTQKDVAQHMDNNVFDVQKCIIMLASAKKVEERWEEAKEDFQTRDLGERGTEDPTINPTKIVVVEEIQEDQILETAATEVAEATIQGAEKTASEVINVVLTGVNGAQSELSTKKGKTMANTMRSKINKLHQTLLMRVWEN